MKNSNKLRVLMIGQKRIPSREGGVEVVVEELATRMVSRGHQVTCYNRGGHHISGRQFEAEKYKNYKGIRMKTIPTLPGRGLAAVTVSILGSIAAAFSRFDVVHYHAEGSAAMCWLPRLFGKRVVVTVHGLDWQRIKWGKFASAYLRFGERCAVKHAHEIIVLSKNIQNYFMDAYGRATRLIPNGVDRPQTREAREITQTFGLEKDGYILFLGRIVPEKGLRYLVEAYKNVHTDKKLVIAGGASDTDAFVAELKALSRGDGRILFTDFVQDNMLEELFSNAYLYALPSDLEGMPLSLLEAMSYGCCCLTSDIAECTEVVEDRAPTFRRGDVADLRSKLQRLCDHPAEVEAYRVGVADFVCRKYIWDEVADQTLALYQTK